MSSKSLTMVSYRSLVTLCRVLSLAYPKGPSSFGPADYIRQRPPPHQPPPERPYSLQTQHWTSLPIPHVDSRTATSSTSVPCILPFTPTHTYTRIHTCVTYTRPLPIFYTKYLGTVVFRIRNSLSPVQIT